MKQRAKRGPGRPPKGDEVMVQLAIRFPKKMIKAIDEIRAGRLDEPDRATVIREMVAKGMNAHSWHPIKPPTAKEERPRGKGRGLATGGAP